MVFSAFGGFLVLFDWPANVLFYLKVFNRLYWARF